MSTTYDWLESLETEVKRFKDTNRYNPTYVTHLYVQADLCITELKQLRAERSLFIKKAADAYQKASTLEKQLILLEAKYNM
jgi:hypothetical protein